MRTVLGLCLLLLASPAFADTINYEWIAQVSSAGTCEPYCGPYGFAVADQDWISGSFSFSSPTTGWLTAIIGYTEISGPANMRIVELNGSTPMVLMSGVDGSYAWLHPTFSEGCGIYGCPQFPAHFDEIVYEVRTNHGPDLDPLDFGPPQARYLNAWCPIARCFTEQLVTATVPEPATGWLLLSGLVGIGLWRYRR